MNSNLIRNVDHIGFLKSLVVTVSSVLFIVCLLNWFVDRAGIFRTTYAYEREIAKLLAQGKTVAGAQGYDDRVLQRHRIAMENHRAVDFLVIGSSRSLQISQTVTTGRLINLSVSGASLEDYVALVELTERISAKMTVVGVDPWVFNVHSDQGRWEVFAEEYDLGVSKFNKSSNYSGPNRSRGGSGGAARRYLQLVNFEYTKSNFVQLWAYLGGKRSQQYYSKDDDLPVPDFDLIRPDGSRVYNTEFSNKSVDDVARLAIAYARPPVYSLSSFHSIDRQYAALFENMLEAIKKRSKTIIFLPPYHPAAWSGLQRRYPILSQVESYIRETCAERDIVVVGSYDPNNTGCDAADFLDGMHPRAACIAKIWRKQKFLNARLSTDTAMPLSGTFSGAAE